MNSDKISFFKQAKPIWAKGLKEEMNVTLGLCKKVIVTEASSAVLKIAVSGFYRVYLNGEFIYYGPTRSAHGIFRADEIKAEFKKGKNFLAIETVNYCVNSFYSLCQPGFVQAELTIGDEVVFATEAKGDFELFRLRERLQRVQRYSYQRTFTEAYDLTADYAEWRKGAASKNAEAVESIITEEKCIKLRAIPLNNFNVVLPDTITAKGRIKTGIRPENYIKDRSLILINDKNSGNLKGYSEPELELHLSDEIQEFKNVSFRLVNEHYPQHLHFIANEFSILSFSCEKTGFITADIISDCDSTLYFLFDEITNADGDINPLRMDCCNAVKINFKKGRYHFMSAEPYGLKYLKILCTKGNISIESIALTETVCPMPITFKYESQDKEINKILNAAKETFIQNSFDFFTDCPTRERAGWLCDSFFLGRAEATFTGQNTIERFFLENYLLTDDYENIPEGMLAYCYPADVDSNGFIPNWAMWFVLELFDYGERTGDNEFVALFKDKVYRLLAWFEKYENCDGLIEKLPGWVFVEWSAANQFVQDINFPSNMLYALMLETASLLYNDTYLKDKAANLKELIRRRSFDGEFFRDNEVYENGIPQPTDNCSETCQYYAFYTKVATPERYPELWDKLLADFGPKRPENVYPSIYPSNAFIGNILRLDLLCQTGNYRQLIKEIKEYYLYMAERTGTLWENIDTSASCNHGFAAYIAGLIKTAEQSV